MDIIDDFCDEIMRVEQKALADESQRQYKEIVEVFDRIYLNYIDDLPYGPVGSVNESLKWIAGKKIGKAYDCGARVRDIKKRFDRYLEDKGSGYYPYVEVEVKKIFHPITWNKDAMIETYLPNKIANELLKDSDGSINSIHWWIEVEFAYLRFMQGKIKTVTTVRTYDPWKKIPPIDKFGYHP